MSWHDPYSRYGTCSYGLESSRPFGTNGKPVPQSSVILPSGSPVLRGIGGRMIRTPPRYGLGWTFTIQRPGPGMERHACPLIALAHALAFDRKHAVEAPFATMVRLLSARPVERVESVEFQQAAE